VDAVGCRATRFTDDEAWSLGGWVAIGALLGGRMAYFLLHVGYFRLYPLSVFRMRTAPASAGRGPG